MIITMGPVDGMRIGRGSSSTARKPAAVSLCPPQMPTWTDWGIKPGLPQKENQQLTTWSVEGPYQQFDPTEEMFTINCSVIVVAIMMGMWLQAAGKYRQQGRNYTVEDGDIIFFKFNAGAGLKDAKKKWWRVVLVVVLVQLYVNLVIFSYCSAEL